MHVKVFTFTSRYFYFTLLDFVNFWELLSVLCNVLFWWQTLVERSSAQLLLVFFLQYLIKYGNPNISWRNFYKWRGQFLTSLVMARGESSQQVTYVRTLPSAARTSPGSSRKRKTSSDSDVQAVLKALKQEDRGALLTWYFVLNALLLLFFSQRANNRGTFYGLHGQRIDEN